MLSDKEQADEYRRILDEGSVKVCNALGVAPEHFDEDASDFFIYEKILENAAEIIEKSGIRWCDESGQFKTK